MLHDAWELITWTLLVTFQLAVLKSVLKQPCRRIAGLFVCARQILEVSVRAVVLPEADVLPRLVTVTLLCAGETVA